MQLGSSNHSNVILMRKFSKAGVFWKAFKALSTVKFYWLEVGEWREREREKEEEARARVLFMNMIMQVAFFFFCLLI